MPLPLVFPCPLKSALWEGFRGVRPCHLCSLTPCHDHVWWTATARALFPVWDSAIPFTSFHIPLLVELDRNQFVLHVVSFVWILLHRGCPLGSVGWRCFQTLLCFSFIFFLKARPSLPLLPLPLRPLLSSPPSSTLLSSLSCFSHVLFPLLSSVLSLEPPELSFYTYHHS